MSGEATPSQMGALLMALRVRGETVDEITGAVSAMRAKMLRVAAPPDAIDVVGTGGDASGSFNISTCAALIVAGAGVPVAKHGNRALSSRSGAADVLAALGVKIDLSPEAIGRCIAEAGIGFMFAPAHHPAMKNVGPTRVELGTRTIFNLLGPLSNPAGVQRQMVGVFSKQWIEPLAQVLKNLGAERAWVVHGSDGLDEITTSGPTSVAALEDGDDHDLRDFAGGSRLAQGQAGGAARRRRREERARRCSNVLKGKASRLPRRRAVQCRGRAGRRRQGEGPQGRPACRRSFGRFRRGRRPARSADRGVERWLTFSPRSRPTSARRSPRRSARGRCSALEREAESRERRRAAFCAAIERRLAAGDYALIAEIKKASPSKGLIRADFDPPALAAAYEAGGAACLSVLTDAPSFQGALEHLRGARGVALPVLRKDFMYDPYQVTEARAAGADCILDHHGRASTTPARASLKRRPLRSAWTFWSRCMTKRSWNARCGLKSRLIGINNRNLKTFETTLATSERLAQLGPAGPHHCRRERHFHARRSRPALPRPACRRSWSAKA